MIFNGNGGASNGNLNAPGSQYAQDYGKATSLLVERVVKKVIFDAAPKQFFDLKLLDMQTPEGCGSDEFFYKQMGYQREPLTLTAASSAATYPNTTTITLSTLDHIGTDFIVGSPAGTQGTVVEVLYGSNQIVVKPMNGETFEALAADDVLFLHTTVEADGTDQYANYFRADTTEAHNFIQLFNRAIRYDEMELHKMQNSGNSNFLDAERRAMFRQFRIDMSNAFWNGKKGEVVTAKGKKAKTMGGVYHTMIEAGSPVVSTPLSSIDLALEQLAIDTEYQDYGAVRFLFGTPEMTLALSKKYKNDKTRYSPNDSIAKLMLDEVNLGSSRIVLVPFSRFKDTSSFPSFWKNQAILLDMENIKMRQAWGQRMGTTTDNRANNGRKRYTETFIDANMSCEFNNPLSCGFLRIV